MSRNRTWSITILCAVFAMIVAACGGAPAAAPTAAPAAAPAAAPTKSVADVPTAVSISQPTQAPTEPTAAPAAEPTTAPEPAAAGGTLNGVTLPADAAPADQQVYVVHSDAAGNATTLDFFESVYKRPAIADILSDALVRIDKNFQISPGAATKWEVDKSGLVWTFTLDPNLMWSDDTPVTADDYVATFRYGANPKHAWDFTWFFGGVIKNWNDVVAGKVPVDQLGVKAADAHTLQFETETPAPYLPAMLLYSMPLQKKALEARGDGLYNSDPATSVSSGPFVLKEWRKGDRVIYEANPKYKGTNKPFIQKVVVIFAATNTDFASYQANEIDSVAGGNLSPADNELVSADAELSKEFHPHYGDFRTDYLFFDTKSPPFDNLKVRQALSHVVDRDALIKNIIKPTQGIPAYSFLMPGFPASNSKELSSIQNYDPEAAKKLLADAGYPDGKGFPKLTLWLRNEAPVRQSLAQAIAASIKQNLNIDVEVSNKDTKIFMDALTSKPTQVQFGMVSYGFDFLDPFNMLSVWLSGGRHNWNNTKFDDMVKKAASFTGDPNERIKMFQDAEKLLVEDVPAVFIYHRTAGDLYRPYLKGSELDPDNNGFAAQHWPGFGGNSKLLGTMYISKDVANFNRQIPQ